LKTFLWATPPAGQEKSPCPKDASHPLKRNYPDMALCITPIIRIQGIIKNTLQISENYEPIFQEKQATLSVFLPFVLFVIQ